jgi:rubrerythrin
MMSEIPIKLKMAKKSDIEKEVLRFAIIAELDAINLYEQLAEVTGRENINKVFRDIAREEKTHVGEFQSLLLELDKEQADELEKGKREVEEIREGKE